MSIPRHGMETWSLFHEVCCSNGFQIRSWIWTFLGQAPMARPLGLSSLPLSARMRQPPQPHAFSDNIATRGSPAIKPGSRIKENERLEVPR
jgi:hypothetical protein